MKKMLAYLLTLSLLLGGVMPSMVYAENYDKNLEEVILKVKALFAISDDYDGFRSNISSYDNKVFFYLNWTDSTNKLQNISVNTDSEGNINSFNKYDSIYVEPSSKLPNYTKDEALKIGLEFIGKVDPIIYKEIKLDDNFYTTSIYDNDYSFRFTRIKNNIDFKENNVSVSVNKFTGDITNYYTNWDRDLEFPKPENIISLETAKDTYINKLGLKLIYKTQTRYPRPLGLEEGNKYYLAYGTIDGNRKGIDAFTGELVNLSYYGPVYENEKAMDAGGTAAEAPIITPEERAEIDKLTGILDIEIVEKKAREIVKLSDEYKLENKNLYSDYNNPGEYRWSLGFIKTEDNNRLPVYVSLDAKTGELVSFDKYSEYDYKAKAAINKDESLQMAKEFIDKVSPDKINHIEYMEDEANDGSLIYYFRFIRKLDNIYVESDSISIGVNAVNKEVSSYYINWYKGDFPAIGDIIPLDNAYETLFNKIGFDLGYVTIYNYDNPEVPRKNINLVYSVNPNKPIIIDAYSGEVLDYSGNPVKDSKAPSYTDIENSYAKDMINTLAEYGIGFTSDKFKPEEVIKQKDFLYLLWKSINPYRTETEADIDTVYKELISRNVVKTGEENRDRSVTKEEAVKFVIRAMKYEKIAELQNIYADIFKDTKDIDPQLKGHLSLAYGLKIISGDGSGLIKPKYQLQRQDAASIIYKYMFME